MRRSGALTLEQHSEPEQRKKQRERDRDKPYVRIHHPPVPATDQAFAHWGGRRLFLTRMVTSLEEFALTDPCHERPEQGAPAFES